jgi:hypothetical protein
MATVSGLSLLFAFLPALYCYYVAFKFCFFVWLVLYRNQAIRVGFFLNFLFSWDLNCKMVVIFLFHHIIYHILPLVLNISKSQNIFGLNLDQHIIFWLGMVWWIASCLVNWALFGFIWLNLHWLWSYLLEAYGQESQVHVVAVN